ncbi:MAG: M23 family metallopeptidase [Prevotellaceae bacterium]|jgi:murein DD-endopeptidase MepM/ murein hydrolase activator NlpD|nr:M23 family metallopeptidase [Prevotellaceae bacterium]
MRHRYKYSQEYLDFVKVRRGVWQGARRLLLYFIGSVLLAIVYYLIFSAFFYTPEERGLLRENQMLEQQYDVLNQRFDQLETVLNDISRRDNQIYRTIFQADPLPYAGTGIGGVNRYEELESFSNKNLVITTDRRLQSLALRVQRQSVSLDSITALLKRNEAAFLNLPAIQPIQNKDLSRTGASVGQRIHPFYKVLREHTGIDFIAAMGVDVMATANGTVVVVERSMRDYGNKIVIDHENGYTTVYAHLNTILVTKGQRVTRGQVIATVGNSGMAMAMTPHLHYEVIKDGEYQDPLNFFIIDLTPEERERMIRLATNSGQSLD